VEALGQSDALEVLGEVIVEVMSGRGCEPGLQRCEFLLGGGSEQWTGGIGGLLGQRCSVEDVVAELLVALRVVAVRAGLDGLDRLRDLVGEQHVGARRGLDRRGDRGGCRVARRLLRPRAHLRQPLAYECPLAEQLLERGGDEIAQLLRRTVEGDLGHIDGE
jgi:hypothetical protein